MIKNYAKVSKRGIIRKGKYKIELNFISVSNGEKQSRSNQFWEIMIGSNVTTNAKE
jgi:hypothetical protein